MKSALCCLLVMVGSFAISSSHAATPRSTDYSFEYSAVGMGGGSSASNDYEMVAYMDESGSASPAISQDYSVEPAVGATTDPEASVDSWFLY